MARSLCQMSALRRSRLSASRASGAGATRLIDEHGGRQNPAKYRPAIGARQVFTPTGGEICRRSSMWSSAPIKIRERVRSEGRTRAATGSVVCARRAAAAIERRPARCDRPTAAGCADLKRRGPHGAPCKLGPLPREQLKLIFERPGGRVSFPSVLGGVRRRLRIDEVLMWRRDEKAPRHPSLLRAG
jgi:hypothetical protein